MGAWCDGWWSLWSCSGKTLILLLLIIQVKLETHKILLLFGCDRLDMYIVYG